LQGAKKGESEGLSQEMLGRREKGEETKRLHVGVSFQLIGKQNGRKRQPASASEWKSSGTKINRETALGLGRGAAKGRGSGERGMN